VRVGYESSKIVSLILFSCSSAKGGVINKASEEIVAESEREWKSSSQLPVKRCREERRTSMMSRGKKGGERLAVGDGTGNLATPRSERRVIPGCGFIDWFGWLLWASQPADPNLVTCSRDIPWRQDVLVCNEEG